MINKRKHRRFPISGSATLKFGDKGEMQSIQSMTVSISLGGMGLYSNDLIEIGTNVSITIKFNSASGVIKTDSIEGRVIYKIKLENTNFIGIQLNEEINPKNSLHYMNTCRKTLHGRSRYSSPKSPLFRGCKPLACCRVQNYFP
jgi:c-di-GMP-binding flagellar brake protein YcgR